MLNEFDRMYNYNIKEKILATDQIKYLKKIVSSTNFGCDIVDGTCISNRKNKAEGTCCSGCMRSYGYIAPQDIYNVDHIDLLKRLYKEDTGFLSKTGCTIPVEYRSVTCLTYHCDNSNIKDSDILKMYLLKAATENRERIKRINIVMSRVLSSYLSEITDRTTEHVDAMIDLIVEAYSTERIRNSLQITGRDKKRSNKYSTMLNKKQLDYLKSKANAIDFGCYRDCMHEYKYYHKDVRHCIGCTNYDKPNMSIKDMAIEYLLMCIIDHSNTMPSLDCSILYKVYKGIISRIVYMYFFMSRQKNKRVEHVDLLIEAVEKILSINFVEGYNKWQRKEK